MKVNLIKHPLTGAVAGALMMASAPLLAATNEELQQRMELLERELQTLRAELQQQRQARPQVVQEQLDAPQTPAPVATAATAKSPVLGDTEFSYGGFIKVDGIWSKSSDQQRYNSGADDYLVPGSVSVGDGSRGGDAIFDSTAKFSRFWLKTATNTNAGVVRSYFEMDFNSDADERLTNQTSNGLRHAYLAWDYSDTGSLLVGQTWSTFMNDAALPEAVDFVGPTSGVIFARQPQVRWTYQLGGGTSLMLSAENPSVSVYDGGSGYEQNDVDDSAMPDLVARYNGRVGDNLQYSVAAMAREIGYSDQVSGLDDSTYGYGVSLSGKWQFSNGDDLKFMLSQGNLGRYLALNAFRDAAVAADGDIDLVDSVGGFLAYRHFWTEKLRSTFTYAMSTADNPSGIVVSPALLETRISETVANANVNLIYSPTPNLSFGAEYIYATREVESGLDGDLKRLQFMGKWMF